MATSKINNPMAWKLQGSVVGRGTVTMPTDYDEIMLVSEWSTYYFPVIMAKSEVGSSYKYPRFASYYNASNFCGGYYKVNNSTANLDLFNDSGTDRATQVTFKLYYR